MEAEKGSSIEALESELAAMREQHAAAVALTATQHQETMDAAAAEHNSMLESHREEGEQRREQAEATVKDTVASMGIDAVLADKQPIIEELTRRLRLVASIAIT